MGTGLSFEKVCSTLASCTTPRTQCTACVTARRMVYCTAPEKSCPANLSLQNLHRSGQRVQVRTGDDAGRDEQQVAVAQRLSF